MIKSLELKNWRTHKDSTLEFGKGTNVIVGVMGSGKSSIVNALSYALFGNFPLLKSKQISLNEIIMNKPNECDEAQTKIIFENNSKTYIVQRIIKKNGTNESKLYENDVLIAGPKQKDVNEKIEKILGLNYELFSRAAYSEQNEMDFFLKLSPSERKKKFDELLELEKYETARKNSITLKNQLTRDNKEKNESIKQQTSIIKDYEEEKLNEQIKIEEEKNTLLKNEKIILGKEIIEKKDLLEKMEKNEQQFNFLKDEINRKKSKKEILVESLKKKEIINKEDILTETKLKKELLEKLKNDNLKIEQSKNIFEEKERKNNEELKVHRYVIRELENEENEIKQISKKCPKCLRELSEEQKNEIIKKGQAKILEIKKTVNLIEINQNENLEKLKLFKNDIDNNKKQIDILKERIFILERLTKEAEEITINLTEIAELEKSLPLKEKELIELKFDKMKMDDLRKNYFEKKSIFNNIDDKIKNNDNLIKNLLENIQRIKKIKTSIQNIEKDLQKSEIAIKKLGVFENCLIATQNELRENLLETINDALTQTWDVLYPYRDFIDAKLTIVENGYDLQVLTRTNTWTRVDGILSGGERSVAAICIRIAFALVLTKQLSIFILDEPTHNLDKNTIKQLTQMLKNSLPELVEQIFVITHEKELENAATSNLYLLERNKDLDEATKIELMPII